MPNNEKKEFKTIEEQVEYLVTTKNIEYSDQIKSVLLERSYSSIINPYKKLFAKGRDDNGHVYYDSINFSKYVEVAAFDDFYASKLHNFIGIFERKLKIIIAYVISKMLFTNGDKEGTSYVNVIHDYFNGNTQSLSMIGIDDIHVHYTKNGISTAKPYYIATREKLLSEKLFNIGNNNVFSNNNLVKYYQDQHHKVPFWLLIHELTMGDLNILFNMLNKSLREEVYCYFYSNDKPSAKELSRFSAKLEKIREIRNIVNHYESLLTYLDNQTQNDFIHTIKVLTLLTDTAKNSIVFNSNTPYFEEFLKSDYNRKSFEKFTDFKEKLDM